MVVRSTVSKGITTSVNRGVGTGGGASGGGETPFSPTDITGLGLWLDAADAATVLNTVSPDVSATDGQTIRRWLDKSGNDLHANQTTGLNQPLYQLAEINSRNATEWDGVNDVLLGQLPACTTCTIFQVHKSSKTGLQIWHSDTSSAKASIVAEQGSTNTVVNPGFGTPTYRVNGSVTTFATRGAVYTAIVTGSPVVLSMVGANISTWNQSPGGFYLGYNPSNAGIGGNLCELLIYDGTLSAENISAVESYLATKWGVTLA